MSAKERDWWRKRSERITIVRGWLSKSKIRFFAQPGDERRWGGRLAAAITDRKWRTVKDWNLDSEGIEQPLGHDSPPESKISKANIVTSEWSQGEEEFHLPVLDIDVPCSLVPSTTMGHYHLYFDVRMPWPKYEALLLALAEAGIVQENWVDASRNRGYSAVRLPWIRKELIP